MRCQLFRNGLQVQHQLRVVANKLANFVDEESNALVRPLALQPRSNILRECLCRQVELLPIAAEGVIHLVAQAGQSLRDRRLRKDPAATSPLPVMSSFLLIGLPEARELSPILQVALKCTDSQIFRVQTTRLKVDSVENLDHR